jgi:4-diphosphocytidyl-2-C-methyl-D-erythritol kinase
MRPSKSLFSKEVLFSQFMSADVINLYPVDQPVLLLAPAKVNLFIDILERRPDGYHNLDAINVSVDLFDEIELCLNRSGTFHLECNWSEIPTDAGNHLIKAAQLMLPDTEWGISMKLTKCIPVGAGLGGGTADAGTLIRYLTRVLQSHGSHRGRLHNASLLQLALQVGSDVPYCVLGGPARVRGRGEIVESLEPVLGAAPAAPLQLRLVLLNPGGNHPTQAIYAQMPPADVRPHPPAAAFIEAWCCGDWHRMGDLMFNAFQEVVFRQRPILAEYCERLITAGCLGAGLTGTGSHLVGLLPPDGEGPQTWDWNEPEVTLTEVCTLPSNFPWIRHLRTGA